MELKPVLHVAQKELRDRLRNRWVLAVALVFTVFALVITYFGGAQQGAVGLRSIEFTIASLVSLVIYLIPLIALLLGFDAIVGERERGTGEFLAHSPAAVKEIRTSHPERANCRQCHLETNAATSEFERPRQRFAEDGGNAQ